MKKSLKLLTSISGIALIAFIIVFSLFSKNSEADSTSWNFKDNNFKSLEKISSTTTVDGLTLVATSSKTMAVKSNSQKLDSTTYSHCLALGGTGSTSYRSVKIPVDSSSTIKVVLMSSSSSTARTLIVADSNGTQLGTITADTSISQQSYKYSGNSSHVYLYSKNSGINIYKIQVDTSSSSTTATATVKPTSSSSSSSVPSGYSVVDASGNGNYKTLSSAISAGKTKIYVKNGTYKEVVNIASGKSGITIIGENRDKTIFTYDNYAGKSKSSGGTYGTGGSASFFVYGSNITIQNITIANSFKEKGESGEQAVALYCSGSKIAFNNCNLTGNQDTVCLYGNTQYFYNCFIQGDVDFIFGNSQAYFEKCKIHSLNRNSSSNNGYITAASTLASKTYGFVFESCTLSAESGIKSKTVYLGRPWCPNGTSTNKAAVAYLNCSMGSHIKDDPWTSMSNVSASHGRFYEYNSSGNGGKSNSNRPQLSNSQASKYTKSNVLGGWNPSF